MLCVHCTLCKIANYTFLSTYSDYFTDSLTITLNTSSYLLFSDYFSPFHFVYIYVLALWLITYIGLLAYGCA